MTLDETDKIKLPFLRKCKRGYYFLFGNTGETITWVLLLLLLNGKMGLVHNLPYSANGPVRIEGQKDRNIPIHSGWKGLEMVNSSFHTT